MVNRRRRGTCNSTRIRDKHRHSHSGVKKREEQIEYINKEYFCTRKNIKISVEMDEMWSFCHDKKQEVWLWRAIGHESGVPVAFWFGTREHKSLNKLMELLKTLEIGTAYTDGNYAYFKHFPKENHEAGKRNTQKIERKHLSPRTWCARLTRKTIRFSKSEQMHKIVAGLVINVWFFGRRCLLQ